MYTSQRFEQYMGHLSQGLGHADRHAGLKGYCTGLMLPLARNSVEPMAARVETEPLKYILSTLPERTALSDLVSAAYQRWRIERDYQDLKQDFGLGHYEGRGWRGFHHHASLSIAAYAFLMSERLMPERRAGGKKNFIERQLPAVPKDYIPRGPPCARNAMRHTRYDAAPQTQLRAARSPRSVPMPWALKQKTSFVTQ